MDAKTVHKAEPGSGGPTVIEQVYVEGSPSHSMYGFSANGKMRLRDLISAEQWKLDGDRFVPSDQIECARFAAGAMSFDHGEGFVEACRQEECSTIAIKPGTWVYVYAAAKRSVVAITNYGDVLLWRGNSWCRMEADGEDYRCPLGPVLPTREKSRGVQFYSSVSYAGRTFMGEHPSGRIFEFDGDTIRPLVSQPPFISGDGVGYEAQSMAAYCGDLYVGYWPTGEIWRWSRQTKAWSLAAALFDEPVGTETLVPYLDRDNPVRQAAFYGRRVTALIPHAESLYAVTSNLRNWPAGKPARDGIDADQYGAVYRITREGCHTESSG